MSKNRGTLLFAFDNELVQYTQIAIHNKRRIEKHYKHEVVIVSDKKVDDTTLIVDSEIAASNSRHYRELGSASFKNTSRCNALDLTPFDETILLDVDYFVNTPTINKIWSGECLKMSKSAFDIVGKSLPKDVLTISEDSLKMYWATIVCFNKDTLSQEFFKNWKELVENYSLYKKLFSLPNQLRNDFAVTLALYKTLDYTQNSLVDLPVSIPTAFENTNVDVRSNSFNVFLTSQSSVSIFSDLHIINKRSLECL